MGDTHEVNGHRTAQLFEDDEGRFQVKVKDGVDGTKERIFESRPQAEAYLVGYADGMTSMQSRVVTRLSELTEREGVPPKKELDN